MAKTNKEDQKASDTENTGATAAEVSADTSANEVPQSSGESDQDKIARLEKKVEHQAALIKDLKEDLKGNSKDAISGKKLVKDSKGKKYQFIGVKHNARLDEGGPMQTITVDFLALNPDVVDKLVEQKAGFLV